MFHTYCNPPIIGEFFRALRANQNIIWRLETGCPWGGVFCKNCFSLVFFLFLDSCYKKKCTHWSSWGNETFWEHHSTISFPSENQCIAISKITKKHLLFQTAAMCLFCTLKVKNFVLLKMQNSLKTFDYHYIKLILTIIHPLLKRITIFPWVQFFQILFLCAFLLTQ